MFVISKSDEYSWPVVVETPKSGGTWDKMTFDVSFKRLKQSEIRKMIDDPESGDQEFCRAVVVGWKGVQGEDLQDVPFSVEALDLVLDEPRVATSIVMAYLASIAGAPQKN